MGLGERPVFLDLVEALADAGVVGVHDVDVGAGAGRDGFALLVAAAFVGAVEGDVHLHAVLHKDTTF